MSVRIFIVDDHAVVRSGLRLLLEQEDDLEPVGEAGSARDAIFQARTLKPDVILLDIVMPEQSGLDVLPQLKHENQEVKVLILSMQDEPRYVREAFTAGASGYVPKEAADNELVAAVRRSRPVAVTSTPSSERGSLRPMPRRRNARRRNRDPTGSGR